MTRDICKIKYIHIFDGYQLGFAVCTKFMCKCNYISRFRMTTVTFIIGMSPHCCRTIFCRLRENCFQRDFHSQNVCRYFPHISPTKNRSYIGRSPHPPSYYRKAVFTVTTDVASWITKWQKALSDPNDILFYLEIILCHILQRRRQAEAVLSSLFSLYLFSSSTLNWSEQHKFTVLKLLYRRFVVHKDWTTSDTVNKD